MPKVVGQDQTVAKRCTCKNCGAVNEYTPGELNFKKINYDYLGDYELSKVFNCAGCGKEIFVQKG